MSEALAFWKQVRIAATNLALDILVEKDGRMSLRHKKTWGDPERPSDAKVATFREFLSRNRSMILEANGIKVQEDPTAEDARRLREWLRSCRDAPDCVLKDKDGKEWRFAETRDHLLSSYQEMAWWVLQAYRFKKVVGNHTGWSDGQEKQLELWR